MSNRSLEEQLDSACTEPLSEKTMDKIAYDVASYWSHNCTDDEFSDNCMENICQIIQDEHPSSCGKRDDCVCMLVYNTYDIIENKYLNI